MSEDRPLGLPAEHVETVRRLKAELRAAKYRLKAARRAETIEAFRALPFGGLNVGGR